MICPHLEEIHILLSVEVQVVDVKFVDLVHHKLKELVAVVAQEAVAAVARTMHLVIQEIALAVPLLNQVFHHLQAMEIVAVVTHRARQI